MPTVTPDASESIHFKSDGYISIRHLLYMCGWQYLVEKGADLEIANRHGHTCLMIACYKGHIAIVRYLLEKGADVTRKSLKGSSIALVHVEGCLSHTLTQVEMSSWCLYFL